MSHYSVIIPSNRAVEKILPLLQSLEAQTEPASAIFIVYDKILGPKELQTMQTYIMQNCSHVFARTIQRITNIDDVFVPHTGVSYVRNFALQFVQTPYLLYIDDDNTFAHDFAHRLLQTATTYHQQNRQDCMLIPTERYRGTIRSRGYSGRNALLGTTIQARGTTQQIGSEDVLPTQFAASNCLRGSTDIFRQTPFAIDIPFVYEDFDMTVRAKRKGIALFCLTQLPIEHHMSPKTKLQDLYIDTPDKAYQKAKNRIHFAHHYYRSRRKLYSYLCIGLWIHTLYLFIMVLFATPWKQKYTTIRAIIQGTKDGLYSLH